MHSCRFGEPWGSKSDRGSPPVYLSHMITSLHNPKIQWVRKLQSSSRERRETQAFIVEGIRLTQEALDAGWEAQLVLHTEELDERGMQIIHGFSRDGAPVEVVSAEVMRRASDTENPQGILATLTIRTLPAPEATDFIFVPDGIRDPGNLGTMLRTAASAGVDIAYLPPGNADAFAPKVVRAAMGAHFRLPIRLLPWDEIHTLLATSEVKAFLADVQRGVTYTQADFHSRVAIIIGGEAQGAGKAARELASERVHIPMPGGMESLNAAAACAVLLFEVVRQRREDPRVQG